MPNVPSIQSGVRPSLPAIVLCCLMAMLWIGGGASRLDAMGQVGVRFTATLTLAIGLLWGPRPVLTEVRPVALLLAATILLPLLQLLPLPPVLWMALPGRNVFDGLREAGVAVPWRPLAMVPGGAVNALLSMIVPLSVFVLFAMVAPSERRRLLNFCLMLVVASTLLALMQFSGGGFANPLINDTPGQVSGNFANRNHLALFLAFGCLFVPSWAFGGSRITTIRGVSALGLLILLILLIIATGSRAGLGLGGLALAIGLGLVRRNLIHLSRRLPRWGLSVALLGFVVIVGLAVTVSLKADRAVGIDRLLDIDLGGDMRSRSLPTVLSMINIYFPAGTGFGSFDPLFRMHEPANLLKLTYFNHAHNDYLEIALNAGIAGIVLLIAAVGWWAVASIRVWQASHSADARLGCLGSAMLFLVFVASAFDYPARTPMVMAMIVVAAMWLAWGAADARRLSLPQ